MTQLPANSVTLSPSQFEIISQTLETVVELIEPLHQLLKTKESLGDQITKRLEELMGSFATIAKNLEVSAKGLTSLIEAETLSPALMTALNRIELQQTDQNMRITTIEQSVSQLMDWLGTPLQPEVAAS